MFVGCRGYKDNFAVDIYRSFVLLIKVVVSCVSCIQKQSGSISSTGSWPGGVVSVECNRLGTVITSAKASSTYLFVEVFSQVLLPTNFRDALLGTHADQLVKR
jgi:hypothetical protein